MQRTRQKVQSLNIPELGEVVGYLMSEGHLCTIAMGLLGKVNAGVAVCA